jgi:hypothetical protein
MRLYLKRVKINKHINDPKLVGLIATVVGKHEEGEFKGDYIVCFNRYVSGKRLCTGYPSELMFNQDEEDRRPTPSKPWFLGLRRKQFDLL